MGPQSLDSIRSLTASGKDVDKDRLPSSRKVLDDACQGEQVRGLGIGNRVLIGCTAAPTEIVDACWSLAGDRLAMASIDGVEVRSFPDGYVLDRLPDSAATRVMAFSPDCTILAVGGDTLRLWDCENRRWLPGTVAHPKPLMSITFALQAPLVASGADDDLARVFEWGKTGLAEKARFEPTLHYSTATYPSAKQGRSFFPDRFYAPLFASGDRELLTMAGGEWHGVTTDDGQQFASTKVDGAVRFLRLSTDGKHMVFCGYEQQARLWDVAKRSVAGHAPSAFSMGSGCRILSRQPAGCHRRNGSLRENLFSA